MAAKTAKKATEKILAFLQATVAVVVPAAAVPVVPAAAVPAVPEAAAEAAAGQTIL